MSSFGAENGHTYNSVYYTYIAAMFNINQTMHSRGAHKFSRLPVGYSQSLHLTGGWGVPFEWI